MIHKLSKKIKLQLISRLRSVGYFILSFGLITFTYTAISKKVDEPPYANSLNESEASMDGMEVKRPIFELSPTEKTRFWIFGSVFTFIGLCCIAASYRKKIN